MSWTLSGDRVERADVWHREQNGIPKKISIDCCDNCHNVKDPNLLERRTATKPSGKPRRVPHPPWGNIPSPKFLIFGDSVMVGSSQCYTLHGARRMVTCNYCFCVEIHTFSVMSLRLKKLR